MRTSQTQLVLGTGLGATGTRSVAAAVDALGIPTCHRFITTADLLLNSTRHDFSAFERFGPRAYFDTPLAHIWPRLACAFPRYRVVHSCVEINCRGASNAIDATPPRRFHTGAHDANALRAELRGPPLRGGAIPRAPEIHRPMPGIRHAMPAARGVAGGLSPQRDSRIKSPRRPPLRPRHQPPRVHGRAGAGALFRSPRASVPGDADLRAQLLLVRRRTARPVRISSLRRRAEAPVRPFDRITS